ncbi:MAG: CsbD family protein [Gemmatimonadaceae bacterium]
MARHAGNDGQPTGGFQMKMSTRDQAEGRLRELAGLLKEKAGQVSDRPDLVVQGRTERRVGKVQQVIATIEKALEK